MIERGTLFVSPKAVTITPSSVRGATAASNMLHDEKALVWQSQGISGQYLTVKQTGTFDVIALVGTNLRATDTIRIRAATTASGLTIGPDYDVSFPAYSGAAKATGSMILHRLPQAATYEFIRIEFTATGHPDNYVQVSNLIVGNSVEWDGIDQGAEVSYDNQGTSYLRKFFTKPSWKITLSGLSANDWYANFEDFFMEAGKRGGFLFVPIYNDEFQQKRSAFVSLVGSPKLTYITDNVLTVELGVLTIQ